MMDADSDGKVASSTTVGVAAVTDHQSLSNSGKICLDLDSSLETLDPLSRSTVVASVVEIRDEVDEELGAQRVRRPVFGSVDLDLDGRQLIPPSGPA